MKNLVCLILTIGLLFSGIQTAWGYSDTRPALHSFVHSLTRMGSQQAEKYVAPNVEIPEMREDTPLLTIKGLPSSKENELTLIGYFNDEKVANERIAFIWKVTFTKALITDIHEVYNGSNPLMNGIKAIEKYENRHHVSVLKPTYFPFDITDVDTHVDNGTLLIRYRNQKLSGLFQLKITMVTHSLVEYSNNKFLSYTLKDGTKALYQPNYIPAEQLLFQRGNVRYTIGISKATKKNIEVDDLIKIANSMISN
ncbi:hypothetical protein CN918_29700 [Priestia megaterium]|nr:hypothetical protein CN918_29700 [Priestia megaterium]